MRSLLKRDTHSGDRPTSFLLIVDVALMITGALERLSHHCVEYCSAAFELSTR